MVVIELDRVAAPGVAGSVAPVRVVPGLENEGPVKPLTVLAPVTLTTKFVLPFEARAVRAMVALEDVLPVTDAVTS